MLIHERFDALQVSEPSAFLDSLKQATVMGLLDATAGGMMVYPTFLRRSSSDEDDSSKSPSSPPANPRQSFFERAGQQMVHDEGMSWLRITLCLLALSLVSGPEGLLISMSLPRSLHSAA